MGLSAIDNVLWDLKARIVGVPVYRLLGGERSTLEVYGSCLGFSTELDPMAAKAKELKEAGFVRQKWFFSDTRPAQGFRGRWLEEPVRCATLDAFVELARSTSVHGASVIPHGHSLHAAMHVVASQPPAVCPLVEYLINKTECDWYGLEADPRARRTV